MLIQAHCVLDSEPFSVASQAGGGRCDNVEAFAMPEYWPRDDIPQQLSSAGQDCGWGFPRKGQQGGARLFAGPWLMAGGV